MHATGDHGVHAAGGDEVHAAGGHEVHEAHAAGGHEMHAAGGDEVHGAEGLVVHTAKSQDVQVSGCPEVHATLLLQGSGLACCRRSGARNLILNRKKTRKSQKVVGRGHWSEVGGRGRKKNALKRPRG